MRMRKHKKIIVMCALSTVALLGISACALIDAPIKNVSKVGLPTNYVEVKKDEVLKSGTFVVRSAANATNFMTNTLSSNKLLGGETPSEFNFTFAENTKNFTISFNDGNAVKYLHHPKSTNFEFVTSAASATVWSYTWLKNNDIELFSTADTGRSLQENSSNNKFGAYSTTSRQNNIKLYRKLLNPVKVTFDSKGGDLIDSVDLDSGEIINVEPKPTKEGFEFGGWYEETNGVIGDTKVVFPFTVSKDTKLVAKWNVSSKRNITLQFDNGNPDSVLVYEKGSSMEAPAMPVKDGYVFDNWANVETGEAITFPYIVPDQDITLIAKYKSLISEEIDVVKTKKVGTFARITGEVTALPKYGSYAIEDSTGAMGIYVGNMKGIVVGNTISITGKLENYNGLIQLTNCLDFKVVSDDITVESTVLEGKESFTEANIYKQIVITNVVLGQNIQKGTRDITIDGVKYYFKDFNFEGKTYTKGQHIDIYGVVGVYNSIQILPIKVTDTAKYNVTYWNESVKFKTEVSYKGETYLGIKEIPTKENSATSTFEFDGWYTEPTFINKYTFDKPLTEDINLYAKFLEKKLSLDQLFATQKAQTAVGFEYTKSENSAIVDSTLNTENIKNFATKNDAGFVWNGKNYDVGSSKGFRVSGNYTIKGVLDSPAVSTITVNFGVKGFNKGNYDFVVKSYDKAGKEIPTLEQKFKFNSTGKESVISAPVVIDPKGQEVCAVEIVNPSTSNNAAVYNLEITTKITKKTVEYKNFNNLYLAYAYDFLFHTNEDVKATGLVVSTVEKTVTDATTAKKLPTEDAATHTYSKEYNKTESANGDDQYLTFVQFENYLEQVDTTFFAVPYIVMNDDTIVYGTMNSTTIRAEVEALTKNEAMKDVATALLATLPAKQAN